MAQKQKKVFEPNQPSLRDAMDLINIISARLPIHKQCVLFVMAKKKAEREKKLQSPTLMHAAAGSSTDHGSKSTSASSGQETHLPQPAPRKTLRPLQQDP